MPGWTTGWQLSMENCTSGQTKPAAREVLCHAQPNAARVRLWSFASWSPTLFDTVRPNQPTTMQATGRSPQTAPDLWSRVPGAGARGEEGRVEVVSRVYPESVPALPVPTGAKQRSHNLMLITHTQSCM